MVKLVVALLVASLCPGALTWGQGQLVLTFDERARAEASLARVDEGRRMDAAEMAALEAYWNIEPTDEMLQSELRRLAREITPPEKLLALYEALDNNPFLINECLARPALVLRMSRDLFAFDPSIHSRARAEAVELRRQLVSGELSPWVDRPGRKVFELARRRNDSVGPVLALEEERESFVLNVILSETARGVRIARYVVPKLTFEAWRETAAAVSPSRPDLYSFCAVEGRAIVLTTDGDPATEAILLDASGEPLSMVGDAWKAPYTGVYYAQVLFGAAAARDEYLLSIDAAGRSNAQESADLSVMTTEAPEPVEAGGLLTYTVVMFNAGPDAALDAEMLALLPDVVTYRSITAPLSNGSWSCTVPAIGGRGKVSCKIKCFGPGSSATFTITVRVDPCVGNSNLTSTMIAASTTADSNPANSRATEQTPVIDPGTCDDANVCTAGDECGPGLGYQEDFDDVSVPFIPSAWTTTLITGPIGARPWRTVATDFYTAPNSAFTPDAGEIRDSVLDSPGIPIVSSAALLRFRNRYILEKDNDGGVLEIKIGDGPFEDILDVGGSFAEGGYNGRISQNFGSPIAGRQAWTDASDGFESTTVNLPPAAAGQTIVIRFRMATDRSLGMLGQWIDSVSITGRDVCRPGPEVACDDANACTVDACDAVLGCGHDPISCDDGNGCTDDVCDPVLQCVYTQNAAPCDDHNACTLTDVCTEGACVGSTAVACHDADVCTADVCDPAIRCVATTANFDTTGFSAGRVDGRDLTVLAGAWNSCMGSPRYNAAADLDHHGACIDESDFHFFMSAFGHDCAP